MLLEVGTVFVGVLMFGVWASRFFWEDTREAAEVDNDDDIDEDVASAAFDFCLCTERTLPSVNFDGCKEN